MSDKKPLEDYEKEFGTVILEGAKPGDMLTQDEFDAIIAKGPFNHHPVNYEIRIKFLEDNGYPVTRENLTADLPSVTPAKGEDDER